MGNDNLFRMLLKKGFLLAFILLCSQMAAGCSLQQENAGKSEIIEELAIIETTEENLDARLRISNKCEYYYKECDNELVGELRKAAISNAAKYVKPGEILYPFTYITTDPVSWINSDPDFPNSGAETIEIRVRDRENWSVITFTIGIEANGDGSYTYSTNYPKRLLSGYLDEAGISVLNPSTILPSKTVADELTNIKNCLFINYNDYMNISDTFDAFWEVCQRIQADEELLQEDLSQKVRFGESDRSTDLEHYQYFYPEHTIDFSSMTEEGVEELEKQVREEQLAFFKAEQPERYEAIQNGSYLSRIDYKKNFYTPTGFYAIGVQPDSYMVGEDNGIRGVHSQAVSNSAGAYQEYRENLAENNGSVKTGLKENWPAYSFHSWEWDILTMFPVNVTSSYLWSAVCSDLYSVRFPYDYYYGCSDESADMIFINNEYEPLLYSWDMEIDENRAWDKGRAYMFLFQGESPYGDDLNAFIEYLDSDRAQEKIEPIIIEDAEWEPGNFSSVYHDFVYAEAETKLRNIAVYSPVAGEGKEQDYHWIILFEEYKDSTVNDSLYKLRDQVMQTFVLLPYWYECRPGDTLEEISTAYMGDHSYVSDICKNPLNRITDPDKIYVGQKIEIPVHLLLKKRAFDAADHQLLLTDD